jgi:hypothetical protein
MMLSATDHGHPRTDFMGMHHFLESHLLLYVDLEALLDHCNINQNRFC